MCSSDLSPLERYNLAVVVTDLEDGGLAAQAGLKVGDFIAQAAGQAVQTPQEFASAIEGKAGSVELSLLDGREVEIKP